MRPVSLEIQGLTSFKEKQVISFSNLDLFAITGPTGAGKTSLVDAITYALYGKVPRVDRDMKQLISQEAERLTVVLEFDNGGETFRVHRATARKGLPVIRLEHKIDEGADEWSPEANGATEVTERIEELLGMDYEGFVRSVLLPQGQFEKFLAGKPEERRRVLDGLLRLNVYAEMQKLANARKERHEQEVARQQFALQQYEGATSEALAAAQLELSTLKSRADELAAERSRLAQTAEVAARLSAATSRARECRAAIEKAEGEMETSRETLETGEGEIEAIAEKVLKVEAEIAATPFDADVLNLLIRAESAYREMANAEARRAAIQERSTGAEPRLNQVRQAARDAGQAAAAAAAALAKAEQRADDARRENVASTLRRGLKAGDPCPVCGQSIGTIKVEAHASLDQAEKELKAARTESEQTLRAVREAETAVAVAEADATSLVGQVKDAESAVVQRNADLAQLLGDRRLSAAQVTEGIKEQNDARQTLVELNHLKDRLARDHREKEQALQAARAGVTALELAIKTQGEQLAKSNGEAATAREELASLARIGGWADLAETLRAEGDPDPVIADRRHSNDNEDRGIQQRIGSLGAEVTRIEEGIEKSAALEEAISGERSRMTLAANLASLLRTTAFPSFIREQALRLLAQDGSRQLAEISGGRYEFAVQNQDFLVSDRWNAGETRSVRTLSGGETFIASLALALALAERLPSLGAGSGGGALESLFIDEGFSHLDPETLDDVASALEVIGQGGERMVGVVTHLTELAERMPARIVVHKTQQGSTVTIE